MISTLALFIALFISTLIFMLGSGLLGSLVSLRMSVEGIAESHIGLVMSGFYIGLIVGSFFCPGIVRRTGHIRAFAAFAALNTAATLLYPLYISPPVWFFFRILTGFSNMGMYMVVESWLADRTEPQVRGRVFSVYMAVTFLGLGFGQIFLNLSDIGGNDLFLIAGIFFALCLVPLTLTRSVHPSLPETAAPDFRSLIRRAPLGIFGSLMSGMIASSFYSLAPVFVLNSGFPVSTVATYMGITILSGLLLQWPVGTLSDSIDRRAVLASLSLLANLASFFIIFSAGRSSWMLFVATAIYGGFAFTLYPVSVAHTNDRIENHEIIAASTAMILFYGIGACLGPISAARAMGWFGPPGLYIFIALCTAFLGVTAAVCRRVEKPKAEDPVHYIPVPRTSPVITSIYPYSRDEEKMEEDSSEE